MTSPKTTRRARGASRITRRRGKALEDAILDAALAELAAGGFETLTFEGVALRAGTGKSAVYRRWKTRQDLAVDAMVHAPSGVPPTKISGELRTDLFRYFRRFADALAGPLGVAVHALGSDQSVAAAARDRILAQRERALRDILEAGVTRGDVRPDALVPDCLHVGAALLRSRFEELGPRIPDRIVAGIVDNVLVPMLRPVPTGADRGNSARSAQSRG